MKKVRVRIWLMLLGVIVALFTSPRPAYAKDFVPVLRLSGADRYDTAAAISREGWKASDYVVLASGDGDDKFADALAGSPLSYALNAPMLLTGTNELNNSTRDEIIRLKARKAIILGGTGSVSQSVEKELNDMNISVERLWGPDRYITAIKIAEKIREIKPFFKVFLTTGDEFQYAMMIAPFASKKGMPILFTEKNSINSNAAEAVKKWAVYDVDIIGNTRVVPQGVEDSLKRTGIRVNRVAGNDISDTNVKIINTYKMESQNIAIARDDLFVDGLAGASFAAMKNMHILLVGQNNANLTVYVFLNSFDVEDAYVFGGPGGVSDYIIAIIRKGIINSPIFGSLYGNVNSGGLAALKDGWIYYQNALREGKLYKAKEDGTEKVEVCSDIPFNINVVGDWIYYTNLNDGCTIYKIRKDGTCRLKLSNDESWNVTVMDNWLYYINSSDREYLYKIGTDGSCRTKLNDNNSQYLNVGWDSIYYVNGDDNRSILRMKVDNTSIVQQLKNVYAWGINVKDEIIYFANESDNSSLYKINTDGTLLAKLCSDSAYDIHAVGDYIYYSNGSDGDRLYKIKNDGKGRTMVYDGSAYLLNIVGDYIYFFKDKEGLLFYKIKTDGTGLGEIN